MRVQAAREPAARRQRRALMGKGESPGVSFAGEQHHGRVRGLDVEHPSVPGGRGPEPGLGLAGGCWYRRAVSSPGVGIPGARCG